MGNPQHLRGGKKGGRGEKMGNIHIRLIEKKETKNALGGQKVITT